MLDKTYENKIMNNSNNMLGFLVEEADPDHSLVPLTVSVAIGEWIDVTATN